MKKLLLSLMFVLSCISWLDAAESDIYVFEKSSPNYNGNTSYITEWAAYDGALQIYGFNNNNKSWDFIAAGRKNNASTAYIATCNPSPNPISEIVLTIGDRLTANDIKSMTLYVADNAAFTGATTHSIDKPTSANSEMTITVPDAASGQYIKIFVDIASASSNGQALSVSKLQINYGESGPIDPDVPVKSDPELSYADTEFTVQLGDDFTAPALNNPYNLTVHYDSSEEAVATVDNDGNVEIVGVGETTITASFDGNDEYNKGDASYTIKVTNTIPDGDSKTVTFDFVNNSYGYERNNSNKYLDNDTKIEDNGVKLILKNTASGTSNWRFWNDGLRATKAVEGEMKISADGYIITGIEASIVTKGTNISVNGGIAESVSAGSTFEWTGSSEDVTLLFTQSATMAVATLTVTYAPAGDPDKANPELSFGETTTFTILQGEEFTAPELSNPNSLTVSYASSDENVATVDATSGALTLTGAAGTTTITASFEGDDDYNAGTASYTLTVQAAASSLAAYKQIAAENGTTAFMNCELTVTYVNNAYVYVKDEYDNYALIYKDKLGYNTGDIIPAGWEAKTSIHYGLFEIVPTGAMPTATETAAVTYDTVSDFNLDMVGQIVHIENVNFSDATQSATNINFEGTFSSANETKTYAFRNTFGLSSYESGSYNMTVAVSYYQANNAPEGTIQLLPIEYRLTHDNHATLHIWKCQYADCEIYEPITEETFHADGLKISIKFEKKDAENHKVMYRITSDSPAAAPARVAARAAEDDNNGFTEYTEPFEHTSNGRLEYYTEHTNGLRTSTKAVTLSGVTGIEDITVDGTEADATYYNLQGVRVEHPAKGQVYIRVAANKATKVAY